MSFPNKHFAKIKTFEIFSLLVIFCLALSVIIVLIQNYFLNLKKNKIDIDEFKLSKLNILENSEVKVNKLKISGNLSNNNYDKYILNAQHAVKNKDGTTNLNKINIKLYQSNNKTLNQSINIQSESGIYDENHKLFLSSSVTNIHYLKYIIESNNLLVDLTKNTIKSNNNVNIFDDKMDIKADSFDVNIDKQILNFNGNIQLKINIDT